MADERGLIGALASAMMEVLADATLPTEGPWQLHVDSERELVDGWARRAAFFV